MRYLLAVYAAAFLCMLLKGAVGEATKRDFDNFQKLHPSEVFARTIDQKTRDCLEAYQLCKKLSNGLHYGDTVRQYELRNKTLAEVRKDMKKMKCAFKEDVIRDPGSNQPKLYRQHTIPIWIFLCADGGVVRVKPKGDPTNQFRPQIHGSKSLRYPFDAKFENFSDEVVKIDPEGNAIPKSRADLAPQHLVSGWSADAHSDLKSGQ